MYECTIFLTRLHWNRIIITILDSSLDEEKLDSKKIIIIILGIVFRDEEEIEFDRTKNQAVYINICIG